MNRTGIWVYNIFVNERGETKMKWCVLNYDFNSKRVVSYNIFNNSRFNDGLKKLKEEYDSETFVEDLRQLCVYCFWSKREYEISVGDLFETDPFAYEKIDVYDQILPNIEVLADYIRENWDND